MSWRTAMKWALVVALISLPMASEGAPRVKRSRGRASAQNQFDATAKKVDLFKAIDSKQVLAQFIPQTPGLAVLRLVNDSEEPLTVEVPLMLGAKPQLPPGGGGGNRNINLALYGTTQVPHAMAGVVNPDWNPGVEKKRVKRKSPRRPAKAEANEDADAPADDAAVDADDEGAQPAAKRRTRRPAKSAKTDEDAEALKPAALKNAQDATVATVPLPVGGEQDLPMICVGLELGKPQPRPAAPYTITELEEATKATEIKSLLQHLSKAKIVDPGAAQVLAWRYTSRKTWEELVGTGLVLLPQLEAAKELDDKITGGAAIKE
ncbi:MAG TPA: hypothetical protein VFW87_17370 [Pirellulales bacterium]|nr:hypothetical protein [Pirellulales bacterium]